MFAVSVCLFYWTLTIAGSFGPQLSFAIPGLQLVIGSKFVLLMAAPLLPAIFCVAIYPECRASLTNLEPSWAAYFAAFVIRPIIPFSRLLLSGRSYLLQAILGSPILIFNGQVHQKLPSFESSH